MLARILETLKKTHVFDLWVQLLIILLPFTTLITVIGKTKLDFPILWFYKEAIIWILFIIFIWNIFQRKIQIRLRFIDWILFIYIGYLSLLSLFTTGFTGLIFGGRYDFSFLVLFFIIYHGFPLLVKPFSYYIKLALISTGIMLFLSVLIKYPFSEDLLLYVGFSGNPSVWDFTGVPPIFHGIDGANVRRFQGILDWPNTMWAFLILFMGIFAYYFRWFKSWYFINGWIIIGLIGLIFYTYSRSALIWAIGWIWIILLANIGYIYKRYKLEFLIMSWFIVLVSWMTYLQYSDRITEIVWRAGSTKWHFERMIIGYNRFIENPIGQWLWSAGPWYRYIENVDSLDQKSREEKDVFYIPESWYIQQFIEWWIVWWVCFIILMAMICFQLYKKHIFLSGMFIWIAIMNLFLHTFESSPFSLLFFCLIGIILWSQNHEKRVVKHS